MIQQTLIGIALTLVFVFIAAYAIKQYLKIRRLAKIPRKVLIKERLIKLLYNPFKEKWWWTKYNPQTRTWEWIREAREAEILTYDGLILSEEIGDKIIALGENIND